MSAVRPTLHLTLQLPRHSSSVDVGESKGLQTGWSSMRGSSQLLTQGFVADPGSMNWTLDNRDGVFDPLRASGPYFGDLNPGMDAAFTVDYAPASLSGIPVFVGKVDDFPQVFPNAGTKRGGTTPIKINDWISSVANMGIYVGKGGMAPRGPERSGQRIAAILAQLGFPGSTVIDPGNAIVAPLLVGEVSAWTHIANCAQAEWGALFVSQNNTFVFLSRDSIAAQFGSSSVATYTDQPGTPGVTMHYSDIQRVTLPIVNDCTVTYGNNGYQVNAQNAVSIANPQWGLRSLPLTLPLHTATQAQQYANWMVSRYATPIHTFSSFTLVPGDDPDLLFPEVINRELTDMVTLELDPLDDGNTITRTVWIRGIAHAFDSDIWKASKIWVQDASWVSGLAHVDVSTVDGADVLAF